MNFIIIVKIYFIWVIFDNMSWKYFIYSGPFCCLHSLFSLLTLLFEKKWNKVAFIKTTFCCNLESVIQYVGKFSLKNIFQVWIRESCFLWITHILWNYLDIITVKFLSWRVSCIISYILIRSVDSFFHSKYKIFCY